MSAQQCMRAARAIVAALLGGCTALVSSWAGVLTAPAAPDHYPQRAIRLVVPFTAGGSSDIVARVLVDALHEELGTPVYIENKAGAGGMIGAELVARAPADGYTVGLGSISTLAVNPVVLKAARVQPLRDFQMVVPLAAIASVFAVPAAQPVHNFAQFVQQARAHGDTWAVGSSGVGSIGHVILEALNAELGLQLRHIPFKGMGPVINSVLAGQTQVLSDQYPSSASHVQSGRLRAFAVAAPQRLPALPEVPTLQELGHPQLNALAITWFGLVVPVATPQSVVLRLNHAVNRVLQRPQVQARLAQLGVLPLGGSPQDLHGMVEQASEQVRVLVRTRGISDGQP